MIRSISIRFDDETYQRVKKLAEENRRSFNGQVLYMLSQDQGRESNSNLADFMRGGIGNGVNQVQVLPCDSRMDSADRALL